MENLDILLGTLKEFNKNILVFMETKSELDDIKKEYRDLIEKVNKYYGYEENDEKPKKKKKNENKKEVKQTKKNEGFSNIIIISMILITIAIIILMFMVKIG